MQVAAQNETRAEPVHRDGGGVARRAGGDGVAGAGDEPRGPDPTAALRRSLDRSPRVQTQLCLQRALDQSPRVAASSLQRVDQDPDDELTAGLDSLAVQREVAGGGPEPPPEGAPPDAPNRTGLPDALKAGIEGLSGLSMDDVRVHYGSARPAQLQALAYAQGADIHLGPGQERHLPHEAWHVVQQKQGRVQPTLQLQGTAVNDDAALEQEADLMGARAARTTQRRAAAAAPQAAPAHGPVQAIMSVATFQEATPGTFRRPRKAIEQIDTALGNYINAPGPNKHAAVNTLIGVINHYLGGQHLPARINYVQNTLLPQAQNELALINALGVANGGLVPGLIVRIGGDAHVPDLTQVAQAATAVNTPDIGGWVTLAGAGNLAGLARALTALQPANASLMRGLIQVAGGGNLKPLAKTITAVQPANAGLLQGLIQAAGGGGNLKDLRTVITHITPANAFLLQGLIPAAGGGGSLNALDNLITALTPANAGIAQALITGAGGNLAGLTALVTAITAPNAYMLQGLLPASGGGAHLGPLTALVTATTAAYDYLLSGLIPAAGGGPNLGTLQNIIAAITPANAHELLPLIPLVGGPGALATLLALVTAAGPAAAFELDSMVRDAGGAAQVPNLIGAINHAHPGAGLLAVDLTRLTAGNAAEFQRLVTALPMFLQLPVGAVPIGAGLTGALAAYNGTGGLPLNRHITVTPANMQHFLSRHTYRFFDFTNIDDLNDQWPFVGAFVRVNVEAQLALALNAVAAGAPAAGWWIDTQRARQGIVIGPYTVTVGIRSLAGGAAPMQVGQFYPVQPGGGVQPFSGPQMRAIHKLL